MRSIFPRRARGLSLSRLDSSIIFEELARGCTSTTAFITIHNMTTWMVCKFGSEETKKWGNLLTSGKALASYCLTEPGAGSDARCHKNKSCRKTEKYFTLSGGKIFSSGAGETDLLLVFARTGDLGPSGISAFAVDSKTPGISFGRKRKKMGWNSQPTRSISFDNVRVSKDTMLGNEGEGFKIAMQGLDGGRINIAACSIGTAQAY